ncbi:MAG: DUF6799 domain-containing protein [Bacteroidota bacterium]
MKKIIVLLAGVVFALAVNAQDSKMEAKPQTAPGETAAKPQPKSHDYVAIKDGKMMIMKDGKMAPMDKEMDMADGSKVMMDGNVMKKDGSKMMMKEGDRMYMNGTMRSASAPIKDEKTMEGGEKK